MASKTDQPKSILKKPSGQKEAAADARELAIHHAKLLQHRKDVEAEILDNLILLSEYPLERAPQYSAISPALSDIASFKTLVRLFQPSDYDDLIIERNVNDLCGYTLCPKPKRTVGPGGEWKLASNGDIVKRKDMEMWCSQPCAKRALFVKVQLLETAAWERAGIPDITIDLLNEDRSNESESDRTARKLGQLKIQDQRQALRDSQTLALERGQQARTKDQVHVQLKEKETQAPVLRDGDIIPSDTAEDHLLVEGHKIQLPDRSIRHA